MLALLGNWRVISGMFVLAIVASVWVRFQLLEADAEKLQSSLDSERALRASAEDKLALNEVASTEAQTTERIEDQTREAVEAAQREIANAETAADIYAALVAGVDGVWADPETGR
jgi:hypothetical protein